MQILIEVVLVLISLRWILVVDLRGDAKCLLNKFILLDESASAEHLTKDLKITFKLSSQFYRNENLVTKISHKKPSD